jgi:hypothetical protein
MTDKMMFCYMTISVAMTPKVENMLMLTIKSHARYVNFLPE